MLKTLIIGLLMGACDIIPGVSGGTIAFITGIYQRLINAIKNCNLTALQLLLRGQRTKFRKYIDGTFLLTLVIGISISILALAGFIQHQLATRPHIVWGLFAGLIIGSIIILLGHQRQRSTKTILALLLGTILGFLLVHTTPMQFEPTRWMIMLAAAIAIMAMILPGISGSFLLVIMGMYAPTLAAIHNRDIIYIALFAAGAIIGLLSFVRIVSRALHSHHNTTISGLIGLLIGSLPKLRPRKETLTLSNASLRANLEVVEQATQISYNVLPNQYTSDTQITGVILFALIGVIFVIVISSLKKIDKRRQEDEKTKKRYKEKLTS